jgi:hypothetical protein
MSKFFEYDDTYYLAVPTMQLKKLGMLAPGVSIFDEPAELHKDVVSWLELNGAWESEDLTGMPTFKFSDQETRFAFTLAFDVVPEDFDEQISKILAAGLEKMQSAVETHNEQGIKNV